MVLVITLLTTMSDSIYDDPRWLPLTKRVYKAYGRKCMATKMTERDGITLSVDHIKPVSKYPHLAFKFSNLQILAVPVNSMKSNKTEIDYRPLSTRIKYGMIKYIIYSLIFLWLLLTNIVTYKDISSGGMGTSFTGQILIQSKEQIYEVCIYIGDFIEQSHAIRH